MDKFIVSARKYRPQNFSTVVGQQHITTTLKNAINHNQLAHAFLFCGPRGVGKTTCARILAKTINCTNKTPEGEACNVCNSCVSFDNGSSMNIHELDAASNNSVDDIRTLVEQVRFAPQAGDYKVYIVDEVHMLSSSAFNAFLKTLEEPPPFAIFILATTEKHKILPTILSRCQIFDFKRITTADTVAHLQEICAKESIKAEEAALHVIAQKSEGCMRDALSILDKIVSFTNSTLTYSNTLEHLNILDEDYFFSMLDFLHTQQLNEALLLFDEIIQKGFEADTFLEGMLEFLRNLLVSTDPKVVSLLDVAEDFKKKYMQVAQTVSTNWMIGALNLLTDASVGYKQARNKKLYLELALIKLTYLQQAMELSGNEGGIVKKKSLEQAKPVAFRKLPIISAPVAVKKAGKKYEEPVAADVTVEEETDDEIPGEASLKIEPAARKANVQQSTVDADTTPTPSFASLKKIQKEIAKKIEIEIEPEELTIEKLETAIHQIAQKLHEASKDSSAAELKRAKLKIVNNNNFVFIASGVLQSRFIRAERALITDFLQDAFSNRKLKHSVEVHEENEAHVEEEAQPLNKKEQYRLMTEKYPLIQQLKDNLKLGLS